MVKRLDGNKKDTNDVVQTVAPKKTGKPPKNITEEDKIKGQDKNCMPAVMKRQEAIDAKMKFMQGSIFGRPVVKMDILEERDVIIPYYYLKFHLHVDRKTALKNLDKDLDVELIYDSNEQHPMQYDSLEDGKLPLRSSFGDGAKRELMDVKPDKDLMLARCEDFIQRKVARRFYGREGTVKLLEMEKFYRPAVELLVAYKNGKQNIKYAYLDGFGIKSERIQGLKYRVENKL